MLHVPRLLIEEVSPFWPKAFPFRTAPREAGALGEQCPAVLLCPGWSAGREEHEHLFLIWMMESSTTNRYSCHSPRTEVDPLLKEQESTDVASTLPRAQTLLEALRSSFEASRLRPKSCQGTGGGSTPASGHPGLGFCSREKQLTKAAEKQRQSITGREVSVQKREYGDEGRAVRSQDNVSVRGGPSTLSARGACTAAWIPAASQPGVPQGEAQLTGRRKHFHEPH